MTMQNFIKVKNVLRKEGTKATAMKSCKLKLMPFVMYTDMIIMHGSN